MLNSHDRSREMLRRHFEDEAARKHDGVERAKAAAREQRERFEAARQHAENIAAEARMRNRGIGFRIAAVLFWAAAFVGLFLGASFIANLGN